MIPQEASRWLRMASGPTYPSTALQPPYDHDDGTPGAGSAAAKNSPLLRQQYDPGNEGRVVLRLVRPTELMGGMI